METLYRKVTFEINDKDHDEIWLIGKSANFIFNPNTRNGEELSDFLAGCEEFPDPTAQLQADKAELLEALERCNNELYFYSGQTDFVEENKSLIQKHKKCQENTPR